VPCSHATIWITSGASPAERKESRRASAAVMRSMETQREMFTVGQVQ